MGIGTGTVAVMEGIHASVAGLDALFVEDAALVSGAGAGGAGAVVDVLQRQYEIRLDRMAIVKQVEAQLAAIKARDAAEAVEIQHAMTPPEAPVHERTYAEMSAVEEIAGVLTISSPAAGALVTQSRQICSLPPVMDALSSGTISWQHAKIIGDETEGLGPAGAIALAAHFLDPDAPNPARGAAAGELVPVTVPDQESVAGANATTPNPSKNATPKAPRTGGWNTPRTATAWPGSRCTCLPTPHPPSGTAAPPSPAASRAPKNPGQ
jgi:hypothetical protein